MSDDEFFSERKSERKLLGGNRSRSRSRSRSHGRSRSRSHGRSRSRSPNDNKDMIYEDQKLHRPRSRSKSPYHDDDDDDDDDDDNDGGGGDDDGRYDRNDGDSVASTISVNDNTAHAARSKNSKSKVVSKSKKRKVRGSPQLSEVRSIPVQVSSDRPGFAAWMDKIRAVPPGQSIDKPPKAPTPRVKKKTPLSDDTPPVGSLDGYKNHYSSSNWSARKGSEISSQYKHMIRKGSREGNRQNLIAQLDNEKMDDWSRTRFNKDPQQLIDEMNEMRGLMVAFHDEKKELNARMARLQKSTHERDKRLDEMLTERQGKMKASDATLLAYLKTRLRTAERTLQEKDLQLHQMRSDLKYSKLEELEVEVDTLYQEVLRLQQNSGNNLDGFEKSGVHGNHMKQLETVLNKAKEIKKRNSTLRAENKEIKAELKAMQRHQSIPNRDENDNEDNALSKNELKKLSQSQLLAYAQETSMKLTKCKSALDASEENCKASKDIISLQKEKAAELKDEIEDLKIALDESHDLNQGRSGRSHSRASNREKSKSRSRSHKGEIDEDDEDIDVEGAVISLQATMRGHSTRKQALESNNSVNDNNNDDEPPEKVRSRSRSRSPHKASKEDIEEATTLLQSAFRGHAERKKALDTDDCDHLNEEEAILSLQSAMRGHSSRKRALEATSSDKENTVTIDDDDIKFPGYRRHQNRYERETKKRMMESKSLGKSPAKSNIN